MMNFDHQQDDTGHIVRRIEAALAIFGVILLAAAVIITAFLP